MTITVIRMSSSATRLVSTTVWYRETKLMAFGLLDVKIGLVQELKLAAKNVSKSVDISRNVFKDRQPRSSKLVKFSNR